MVLNIGKVRLYYKVYFSLQNFSDKTATCASTYKGPANFPQIENGLEELTCAP